MRIEKDGYLNRVEIACSNVWANRSMRPADMINGFRMIQPLRSLDCPDESFNIAKLAMDIFTRLKITYQPRPEITRASLPPRKSAPSAGLGRPRVGLFVDAPDHLSGVALTLAEWLAQANEFGHALTIHSCGARTSQPGTVNFDPMGTIKLDDYAGLTLHVPHVDDMLRYIENMPFDVIHVSTPGPMGLLGLLAARHRGLPICGTYHTDFPRYAGALAGDPGMEEIGWKFMRWFYGQLDRVAAPTESIRRELIAHGFDSAKLAVVGRGVNTKHFSPAYRSDEWRSQWGGRHSVKLLYVGRLSKEKNLETLVQAFRRLCPTRPDICLIVVGDGPYRNEMEQSLHGLPVFFTGTLKGRDLAATYASCDLFVFPSKTDTFGRVVLEAQASGLPVIVSSEGGPKDAMLDRRTGLVLPNLNEFNLSQAVDALTDDPARHARYRGDARSFAETLTLEASFNAFWNLHRKPFTTPSTAVMKVKT